MTLPIRRTSQFKKDVKLMIRSGKELEKLLFVVNERAEERKLAPQFNDHALKGDHKGKRDCHIEPDWLLIYAVEDDELVLYRTGSRAHSFG